MFLSRVPESGLQIIPISALAARDLRLNRVCNTLFSLFILLASAIYIPTDFNENALITTVTCVLAVRSGFRSGGNGEL